MEQSDYKFVSRPIPIKPRFRKESRQTGKVRRGLRPLWLNSEALQMAEQCAKGAGMPVASFVEGMLFEICGPPAPVEKAARPVKEGEVRVPGRVTRIHP